jgi:hypothetical protein
MTSLRRKLTALACHPTKFISKASNKPFSIETLITNYLQRLLTRNCLKVIKSLKAWMERPAGLIKEVGSASGLRGNIP